MSRFLSNSFLLRASVSSWFPILVLNEKSNSMKSSVRSSNFLLSIIVFLFLGVYNFTNATVFTMLSPIGPLPSEVTQVGGIVFQAKGLSGAVVTSQLSASSRKFHFLGRQNTIPSKSVSKLVLHQRFVTSSEEVFLRLQFELLCLTAIRQMETSTSMEISSSLTVSSNLEPQISVMC